MHNKFKKFSNNNFTLKTDDYKYVNLQIKVSFLLKNIKLFTEDFNIITQDHHKLWVTQNFEFPTENKMVDIVLNNEIKQLEKIKLMTEMQKMVEDLDINAADNMIIDNETEVDENNTNKDDEEEIDFPQYMNLNKKKRRKGKSDRKININLIRELNKNNYFYEIEDIIKHKVNENSDYTFLVKWKDYDSNNNSWVNEKDFNTKDLIKDYFCKQNIKY